MERPWGRRLVSDGGQWHPSSGGGAISKFMWLTVRTGRPPSPRCAWVGKKPLLSMAPSRENRENNLLGRGPVTPPPNLVCPHWRGPPPCLYPHGGV